MRTRNTLGWYTLVAVLTACRASDSTQPLEHTASATMSPPSAIGGATQGVTRTLDDYLETIADRVPEFAGVFRKANGRYEVLTTTASARGAAIQALGSAGVIASTVQAGEIDARVVRYSFKELRNLYRRLHRTVSVSGLRSVDVDERANVLRLGVREAMDVQRATEALGREGFPQDAFVVSVSKPVAQLARLTDRVRPVRGGLMISRRLSGLNIAACTMSVPVRLGGIAGFFTNSHCSPTSFGLDNVSWYQADAVLHLPAIGTETVDPLPQACTMNGQPALCRQSDAAFVQFSIAAADYRLGMIAAATGGAYSLTLNSNLAQQFMVIGYPFWPFGDLALSKTGQSTGRTIATVNSWCEDFLVQPQNVWLLCQNVAGANNGQVVAHGGDSGSPVHEGNTYNGILWGGLGCNPITKRDCTEFIYSPGLNIFFDFGSYTFD